MRRNGQLADHQQVLAAGEVLAAAEKAGVRVQLSKAVGQALRTGRF